MTLQSNYGVHEQCCLAVNKLSMGIIIFDIFGRGQLLDITASFSVFNFSASALSLSAIAHPILQTSGSSPAPPLFTTSGHTVLRLKLIVYYHFHILPQREENVHKCHIALLSVLRNALTRNGGGTGICKIYSLLKRVYFVHTTSISCYWIPGIPAC